MKLYEIAAQYRDDVARLQDLDLPPEVVLDTIDAMQGDIAEKIKAVVVVALEIEAEGQARAEHAKRMAESSKATLHRAEALRSYAQIAIQNCGLVLPLKYPEFNVTLHKNPPSCEITNNELLPRKFKNLVVSFECSGDPEVVRGLLLSRPEIGLTRDEVEVTTFADKRAVLAALKDGEKIDGARMNPTIYRLAVK
jgi:hypothetical protein